MSGTSDFHHISDVLHVVEQLRPFSILEIGVGFGKWGILCRDILDVYEGRFGPGKWRVRLDGIEVFESYRNLLWDFAYNQVIIGDAIEILPRVDRYDLILCCDVIEHFEKEDGRHLLDLMLDKAKVVIITSPRGFHPQGAISGNEYEIHRSGWSAYDFERIPCLYKDVGFTFMAVLSKRSEILKSVQIKQPLDVLGIKGTVKELIRLLARRMKVRLGLPT